MLERILELVGRKVAYSRLKRALNKHDYQHLLGIPEGEKVLTLLSGGIDSTVNLYP